MSICRRAFLQGAAAAVVAAIDTRVRSAEPPPDHTGPVIDTHQHVWDLKRFRLPWLDRAGERLRRSYGVEEYAKAIGGLKVTRAVYVEVAVVPEQRAAEAEYVIELCRSKAAPTAVAVIGGGVGTDDFGPYIRGFKDSPYVKGVRHGYPRGGFENAPFIRDVRLLGDFGMSFDLLMGSDLLAEAAGLVRACPATRFVLDHCGNPDVNWWPKEPSAARKAWEEGIARLAANPNVICKISGVAESGEDGKVTADTVAPAVNYCLDRFGEDRVIFASNWPVCLKTVSFKAWVEMLREVVKPRGEAFGRRLFHDNAAKFFGI